MMVYFGLLLEKFFHYQKESKYLFPEKLVKNRSFARLKLISPFSGIIKVEEKSLQIITKEKNIYFKFIQYIGFSKKL